MGVLEVLAEVSRYIPAAAKPARRPTLPTRLMWTGLVVLLYLIMSEIPLVGVYGYGQATQATLMSMLLGMNIGTLMTLGIGPIVTAGIVLEVLVGGKLIELDLTKPRDRKIFMGAQRTLALLFALLEAAAYVIGCRFWISAFASSPEVCPPISTAVKIIVVLQLVFATLVLMWFDEMIRNGWGIGSALSLFIVASVVKGLFWQLAGSTKVATPEGQPVYYGWLAHVVSTGDLGVLRRGMPDMVGFLATIAIIMVLIYFQLMRVYIPVTSPRYGSIKTRIPLNFIYVTNIPILFVAIAVSDIKVFEIVIASLLGADNPLVRGMDVLYNYVSPPRGLLAAVADPLRTLTFALAWLALGLLFGFIWVEIAGLSPRQQAENLIKSGMELPGIRKNVKLLERILARYIYPLTVISSLLVTTMAILADVFGAYGTGSGLVLLVGIIYNFYQALVYERTLEMYPTLQRLLGR
ncbi:preprotein translocase subunit SecY [Hyperthermus butylicus]|uniref:Preprotein translocase subunit secY n=1 Tax=Hyperthermus butylicus (strain DSM 5456 / JCM 9403 / PLM1-5) TaxID=415426 RepID=A2BME2_HYPBU|nr:preprotein translocase subunit SecY [Hyperthermus butylicus]ABM81153.1 Preprotein translocase subunit secY [Hyperthermus butylicus DSM 5456]